MSFSYTMQDVQVNYQQDDYLVQSTSKSPVFTYAGHLKYPAVSCKCVVLDSDKKKIKSFFFSSDYEDNSCNVDSENSDKQSTFSNQISSESSPESITGLLTSIPVSTVNPVLAKEVTQKSPLLNGQTNKLAPQNSPIKEPIKKSPISNGTPNNSVVQNKRKRLLSERGEKELLFPYIDNGVFKNTWKGFDLVKFKKCGVGLFNNSNDCFLNSVLQSIVHMAPLARYIYESHRCNNKNNCISCALRVHITRAITSPNPFEAQMIQRYLGSLYFLKILYTNIEIFPQHRRGHQEDAHELLTLLLCALEPTISPLQNGNIKRMPSTSTPIEQIFGGTLRNQIICGVCQTVHTNYERIREINLAITRNYNPPGIMNLMQDFFKPEQLQLFTCKKCNSKRSATRHTKILRAPSVLIIQLKRFNLFGGKNRTYNFMYDHVDKEEKSAPSDSGYYRLDGIIQHIGGGINSGHYNCAWRGFDEKTWYMFDDSMVRSC